MKPLSSYAKYLIYTFILCFLTTSTLNANILTEHIFTMMYLNSASTTCKEFTSKSKEEIQKSVLFIVNSVSNLTSNDINLQTIISTLNSTYDICLTKPDSLLITVLSQTSGLSEKVLNFYDNNKQSPNTAVNNSAKPNTDSSINSKPNVVTHHYNNKTETSEKSGKSGIEFIE